MRAEKLREMTVDELRVQETQLQDQIFRLRFQIAASQAENPARVHLLRKDLARVKTVLRQKVGPRLTGRAVSPAVEGRTAAAPAAAAPAAEPVAAVATAATKAATGKSKAKASRAAAAPAGRKRGASAGEAKGAKGAKR